MSRGQPADDGGRRPKRLAADPRYATRVAVADDYGIPLSEFSGWETDDKDAALGGRIFTAEKCDRCGTHPSVWKPQDGGDMNALVPVWRHCRVCELIEHAKASGPPSEDKGWRLVLEARPHNHRREATVG